MRAQGPKYAIKKLSNTADPTGENRDSLGKGQDGRQWAGGLEVKAVE